MPDRLRINLLGDLALRRGDEPVPLPASRRTRALLGYLVATAAPQSRSSLCDLLWDGPEDPRAALRWSLTKLRAVVDDDAGRRLVADREHVAFDAQQCEVDIAQAQALLAGGVDAAPLPALEQAATLLQGEFLDGLDLPACFRFHHWCMAERERHGALRRRVLEALVARLAHEPERALPYGRAMVAADPLSEGSHATLVRLLAAAGRYPDAEQHHAWARELLQREIALPAGGPLDEAIRRVRRVQREAGAGATVAAPPADAGMAAPERPLVGRHTERAAIAQAVAGDRRCLLLFAGEPGIGKTRLLDHLADTAVAAGQRVVRGRCFEAEMVRPYGPWLDAMRGVSTAGVEPDTLAHAAPLLSGAVPSGGDRERLFGATAALLRALAAPQPLVLLLDDLQWIDEGSAALLHFVARTLDTASPVLLAGATRAGELDDNPWAKRLLQSLARDERLRRFDLAALQVDEAGTLLGDAAASIAPADALRQTGGNPLYLIELARALQRGGDAGGRSVDRLIGERLAALDDAARDLLAWAAAMGREMQPELLAAAAGLPVATLLSQLERLARHGLLAARGDGALDFAHDLVRQAVYRALSQPRRRAIHRQIARALEAASADDPWLHGEIVRHAGLAGDAPATVRACLAAGEHCLRVFANAEAAAVADRGLAGIEALPVGAERVRLEIALLRLRVAAGVGTGGRRLPALADRIQRAIAAAEALALHAQAAAGWEILSFWNQQASDTARAHEATLAAERLTRQADQATHCQQLANSGRCLLEIEADPARGRALLAEAATLADALGLTLMEIEWGRGLAARADGDLEAASAALARAVALAELAGVHWREYECRVWLATLAYERGRDAEVLQRVDEILQVARRMGEAQAPFAGALAALARWRQGDAHGEAAFADSVVALRELDDKAHLAYVLNEAGALALAAARHDDARAFAAQALADARAVNRPTEIAVASARLALADPNRSAELLAPLAAAGHSARAAAALATARAASTLAPTATS